MPIAEFWVSLESYNFVQASQKYPPGAGQYFSLNVRDHMAIAVMAQLYIQAYPLVGCMPPCWPPPAGYMPYAGGAFGALLGA